jgi:hypothetical protein
VSGAVLEGKDWAEEWISTAAKTDDLATDSILLGGEGECSKRCAYDVGERNGRGGRMMHTDPKLDVRKTERTSVRNGASIFAQAKKKEKGDNDHVCNGVIAWVVSGISSLDDVPEDLDRNRLDTVWGWILPFVTSQPVGDIIGSRVCCGC